MSKSFKVERMDQETKKSYKNDNDDFSEYMWMEDIENFDREVRSKIEEEDYIRSSIELLLDEEERETVHFNKEGNQFLQESEYAYGENPGQWQQQYYENGWGLADSMNHLSFSQPRGVPAPQQFLPQPYQSVRRPSPHNYSDKSFIQGGGQPAWSEANQNGAIIYQQQNGFQQNGFPQNGIPQYGFPQNGYDHYRFPQNGHLHNSHQQFPVQNSQQVSSNFALNPNATIFVPGGRK